MPSAARSYVTASAAILGAGVLVITPISAAPPDIKMANPAVQLSAATTVNGLVAAIANIPANEVKGLQLFADALAENGSIWVFGPDNLLGWDVGDFSFGDGIVATLVPFPALAVPIANNLNAVLNAELPASPSPDIGCQGIPGPCPDPIGQIKSLLQVPIRDLIESGALQPFAPIQAFVESLGQPAEIEPLPTVEETVKAITGVAAGIVTFSNPFAPGSTFRPTIFKELGVALQGWIERYSQHPGSAEALSLAQDSTKSVSLPSLSSPLAQRMLTKPDTDFTPEDNGRSFERSATSALSKAFAGKQKADADSDGPGDHLQQVRTTLTKPLTGLRAGNKSAPGRLGVAGQNGEQKSRTTIAGAVKSVNDKISAAVDKAASGLKHAGAKTDGKPGGAPAGDNGD